MSRRTVVAALDILHEKGLVHGVVGRGTFVVEADG
ncbi:GntR family transcriptional regulator [Actinomadura sp. LD22]|uniref:GntR family transcriptional regulator n=1 Tax=Actinomadura physcomitrii TaxID=2650748 RepID=A0A6I4MAF3_9ACTN|nr:GntR family transcriptional regulator [Actinomadura physcomitrii]